MNKVLKVVMGIVGIIVSAVVGLVLGFKVNKKLEQKAYQEGYDDGNEFTEKFLKEQESKSKKIDDWKYEEQIKKLTPSEMEEIDLSTFEKFDEFMRSNNRKTLVFGADGKNYLKG